MNVAIALARRNLRLFFRDRAQVFFSLLSVFIVIGLYVLFLGDMMNNGVTAPGVDTRFLMDSWIMAGLVTVTSVTTIMGAFGILVEDKTRRIVKDFKSAPIRRWQIVAGYFLSSLAIGMIMCIVALALTELYVVSSGGRLLPPGAVLRSMAVLMLAVLCSCAMIFCLASLFQTSGSFSTASMIVGTMIGFLTGIYVPIGSMPEGVQTVIRLFPPTHAAVLLRQIMMEVPMNEVFAGAPPAVVRDFSLKLGVELSFFGETASPGFSLLFLALTTLAFFGLALVITRHKKS